MLLVLRLFIAFLFFFSDTATTELYTLSLHDALPIWSMASALGWLAACASFWMVDKRAGVRIATRSEEHTSELQSRGHLVCRLLLEKKKGRPIGCRGRRVRNEGRLS